MPKVPTKSIGKITKAIAQGRVFGKLFDLAEKQGKVWYRYDTNPKRLLNVGFVKDFGKKYKSSGLGKDFNDVSGIFYAKDRLAVPEIFGSEVPINVEAIQLSPSKDRYIQGTKLGMSSKSIRNIVDKENPDFLHIQDWEGEELQQLKPNTMLARIRVGNRWKYRILGAAAATGLGLSQQDQEAEAMPLGVVEKAGTKLAGPVSSRAKVLIGKVLPGIGKTIKNVIKGTGELRDLHFTDGTHMTVNSEQAQRILRAVTTQEYLSTFASKAKNAPASLDQAMRSLVLHEGRATTINTKRLTRAYTENYIKDASVVGVAPDLVYVTRNKKYFSMPRQYAERLEQEGILKIDRSPTAAKSLGGTE